MIDKNNSPTPTGSGTHGLPASTEQQVKDDAGALLDTARSELSHIKAEAETQAGAIAEEAKAELGKVADKARGMAAEQKDMLASQVEGVAQAVNKVAGELEADDSATAGYARTVADTVNQFSETLKTKDVDQLLHMAEDFGRKQPAAFAGVMAIAGFAASRFLVASSKRRQQTDSEKAATGTTGAYGADANASSYGNGSDAARRAGNSTLGGGF
jgi:hypothetical protein